MKNRTFVSILLQVILVFLNVLFFLWVETESCSTVTWISYACTMLSYVVLEIAILVPRRDNWYVWGLSLIYIATMYFIVVFVSSVALSLVVESITIALSVQLILALIFIVWGSLHLLANRNSARTLQEQEQKIEYVRIVGARLKSMTLTVTDVEANKELKKLYDIVWCSPIKSNSVAREYERKVILGVGDLEKAVVAESWGDVISITRGLAIDANTRNSMI